MNRLRRRMARFGKGSHDRGTQQKVVDAATPQDVTSVRAKNSGHGKKTADKWNQ
ncbi:MAG TPA: hypothetical protein VFL66_13185 [Gaiellaceae bacterium]|nr:hypothetical protein [Gaiellaceae bacterium]